MTNAPRMSFPDFLAYSDSTNTAYELEHSQPIPAASALDRNQRMAIFLLAYFVQLGIPAPQLRMKVEIVVLSGQLGVRVPDLVILSEELAHELRGAKRSLVLPEMPTPLLVAELVSPYQASRTYRYKRSEYAARGIPEYWIIDPMAERVTILQWSEGYYEQQIYRDDKTINSPLLGKLTLTAAEILQAI